MASLVWDNGISVDECELIINTYKNLKFEQGAVDANAQDQRKSLVYWIREPNTLVRSLFQFLIEANDARFRYSVFNFSQSISNDTVQFTVYNETDYYNWHQDILTQEESARKSMSNRKVSLTVNLSDPKSYEGGDLEFFAGEQSPISSNKKQGSVVCFDSYDWHRVTPVTKGTRYSLVLWIWGPDFI